MFKRRRTQGAGARAAAWFWPRSGWPRAFRYMLHRLSRLPGTPYSLAAGFAVGAAVSFTPLVGFHFVIGALLAWLMRANVLASIIGTTVGNPWTFPFIWLWLHTSGQWIMMKTGLTSAAAAAAPHPAFHKVFAEMFRGLITGDWLHAAELTWPVIGPMLLASVPTGLVIWLVMFWTLKSVIGRYQSSRRRRRMKNLTGGGGDAPGGGEAGGGSGDAGDAGGGGVNDPGGERPKAA